ncbi:MAG: alpha/beta hydrolase [Beijerinckiaceae bacterium]|nr:alpha/beta hydrolase [Beijerinckiaceae bacterium]
METANPREKSVLYTALDGLRLHLRDYDPGSARRPPAVCLPGLTRNADDFASLARALAFDSATPRRVVAFDYRGRGLSAYDPDWRNYNLAVERGDILGGLALLGIEKAHVIGTSRGGLQILSMAAEHRTLFQSVVLNDIGPVLEIAGLARIKSYIGSTARPRDYAEAIALLKAGAARNFPGLSPAEWRIFAAAVFGADEANLAPRYDPELAHALDSLDLNEPIPDLWAQYDALNGLPLLTIRGEMSDLLSPQTFAAMGARWPGCELLEVPGQGHAPLLADSRSIATIEAFLAKAD